MNLRSRVSIFDTLTSRTTINTVQLRELVNFVLLNRGYRMNAVEVRSMLNIKSLATTAISSIFSRAIDEFHRETLFSFLRIPPTVVAAPEVVTYNHVTFDMKQLNTPSNVGSYTTLGVIPELANTIVSNVTPLLRRSGELTDALSFQSLMVRDLLSRSYFTNTTTTWLTPTLLRFLCRFYNMSMASAVSGAYNLTYQEQQVVATVFSLYFMQLVSDTDTAESLVKTSKLNLGLPDQILGVISRLKDILGDRYAAMNLTDVCTGLNNLGITRLTNVDTKFIRTRQKFIGPDVLTSSLAIEYPPYWCYLVLSTLSGRKMGLTMTMKRNDLSKDAPTFAKDLLFSQSFLAAL